jgi:hypothetical protein
LLRLNTDHPISVFDAEAGDIGRPADALDRDVRREGGLEMPFIRGGATDESRQPTKQLRNPPVVSGDEMDAALIIDAAANGFDVDREVLTQKLQECEVCPETSRPQRH